MKKNLWMLLLACSACMAWSCSDDDPIPQPDYRVLTFEDADYKGAAAYYWSSLIDDQQYNGDLLYNLDEYWTGHSTYSWYDAGNTELEHSLCTSSWDEEDMAYWNGGHAVSNYIDTDIEHASYLTQLAIPVGGGHSGSNFCVHNGYDDGMGNAMGKELPAISFHDGVARTIEEMWVVSTTYVLNELNKHAGTGTWLKVVATGYDAAGAETGVAEIYLEKEGQALTEWTKWPLAGLGKVVKVVFNVVGCPDYFGPYGMDIPGYFAYDDVKVLFE